MENKQFNTPYPYYEDDEITLKELILKIRGFYQECKQKRRGILYFSFLGALLFLLIALIKFFTQDPSYTAKIDFAGKIEYVSRQNGYQKTFASFSELMSLELQEETFSGTLLEKVKIKGKNDFLINHFIDIYKLHESWENNSNLLNGYSKDYYFSHDSIASFNTFEQKAIRDVKDLLLGFRIEGNEEKIEMDTLFNLSPSMNYYGSDAVVHQLMITTINSELSEQTVATFYQKLANNYIEEKKRIDLRSLKILADRQDSLYLDLSELEKELEILSESVQEEKQSVLKDLIKNQTLIIPDENEIVSKDLLLNIGLSTSEYSTFYSLNESTIRAYEDLYFRLENETINFIEVNKTFEPLDNSISLIDTIKSSGAIMGFFLSLFLALIYVIGNKIVQDALVDE